MHALVPEPSLAELLDDPLVQLLMASDGISDSTMRRLIRTIREARRASHSADDISQPHRKGLSLNSSASIAG